MVDEMGQVVLGWSQVGKMVVKVISTVKVKTNIDIQLRFFRAHQDSFHCQGGLLWTLFGQETVRCRLARSMITEITSARIISCCWVTMWSARSFGPDQIQIQQHNTNELNNHMENHRKPLKQSKKKHMSIPKPPLFIYKAATILTFLAILLSPWPSL